MRLKRILIIKFMKSSFTLCCLFMFFPFVDWVRKNVHQVENFFFTTRYEIAFLEKGWNWQIKKRLLSKMVEYGNICQNWSEDRWKMGRGKEQNRYQFFLSLPWRWMSETWTTSSSSVTYTICVLFVLNLHILPTSITTQAINIVHCTYEIFMENEENEQPTRTLEYEIVCQHLIILCIRGFGRDLGLMDSWFSIVHENISSPTFRRIRYGEKTVFSIKVFYA